MSLRKAFPLALLFLFFTVAGCNIRSTITNEDLAGQPTVLAKVVKEPNPLLVGRYHRPLPSEFNHPWNFDYWLVKKGDAYAVYYYRYSPAEGKKFRGWAEFTIDGDTMTSTLDGVTFSVEGGAVIMKYPGREASYRMVKVEAEQ